MVDSDSIAPPTPEPYAESHQTPSLTYFRRTLADPSPSHTVLLRRRTNQFGNPTPRPPPAPATCTRLFPMLSPDWSDAVRSSPLAPRRATPLHYFVVTLPSPDRSPGSSSARVRSQRCSLA